MNASSTAQMKSDDGGAPTIGDYVDANSDSVALCWGPTTEELAQNKCNGNCGGGAGNGSMVDSDRGAQIKDFENVFVVFVQQQIQFFLSKIMLPYYFHILIGSLLH